MINNFVYPNDATKFHIQQITLIFTEKKSGYCTITRFENVWESVCMDKIYIPFG